MFKAFNIFISKLSFLQFWTPKETDIIKQVFAEYLEQGIIPDKKDCGCAHLPNKSKKQTRDKIRTILGKK